MLNYCKYTFIELILILIYISYCNRPDGTSGKQFASVAGGMGFKSRADQISHS